jgi:fructokinase
MPADEEPTAGFDVVVVAEALVDIVVSPRATVEHPGGSPANVAYGLGRLGADTALLTSIGDDQYAATIEKHLLSAGVHLLPGSTGRGATAMATAVLASDGSAHFDFDIRWDLPRVAPATLPKVLHTGSIATFLAPGAAVVRELPWCTCTSPRPL